MNFPRPFSRYMEMNSKKICLVIGSGGREHAIVEALTRSERVEKIYCAPGNAGIAQMAECVKIGVEEVEKLADFAEQHGVGLTIVGPEASLAKGVVDCFRGRGLKIFGPTQKATRIESSKEFAKDLMAKYNVPTADYQVFTSYDEALAYVSQRSFPTVLKYDGLAAGKGVVIPQNQQEAEEALKDMLLDDKFGKGSVVVEEFLEGEEFSFMCFVSGEKVLPMVSAQDHKRAFDGDEGPNTGGMGAYSPVRCVTKEDEAYALEHIMLPVAKAMVKEGCPFEGVLYGGLMKTPKGIKVIEFNARFGDPETEVVLPRLKSDLVDVVETVLAGETMNIEWYDFATLGVVLASKGYPSSYEKGFAIKGLKEAEQGGGVVFHMGTKFEDGSFKTAGGRVVCVVGRGETLEKAALDAYRRVEKVECENFFHRQDIGWRSLK